MEELLRESPQRTPYYFNRGHSSSRSRSSQSKLVTTLVQKVKRQSKESQKPQKLKSSHYRLCHVRRSHQARWRKSARQAGHSS